MKKIFTFLSVGVFSLGFAQQNLVDDLSTSNPTIYQEANRTMAACTQNVPSNNLENGSLLGGSTHQAIAADILVAPGQTFTVSKIAVNLVDPSTFINVVIYSDATGKPGTVVHTLNNVPSTSVIVGNNFGKDFYRHTIVLPTPIVLSGASKFWMEIQSDALAWENQKVNVVGSNLAFKNDNSQQVWTVSSTKSEVVYTIEGDCVLAVGDADLTKLSFYPNPVKNTLKFSEKVSQITIFDLSGKAVKSVLTNSDSLDVSDLPKGNYMIQYITRSGKKVSNKLIKE